MRLSLLALAVFLLSGLASADEAGPLEWGPWWGVGPLIVDVGDFDAPLWPEAAPRLASGGLDRERRGPDVGGGEIAWAQLVGSRELDVGELELKELLHPARSAPGWPAISAAFLTRTVHAGHGGDLSLLMEAPGFCRVWLNGKQVASRDIETQAAGWTLLQLQLEAGDNELVFKIGPSRNAWSLRLRSADAPGDDVVDEALAASLSTLLGGQLRDGGWGPTTQTTYAIWSLASVGCTAEHPTLASALASLPADTELQPEQQALLLLVLFELGDERLQSRIHGLAQLLVKEQLSIGLWGTSPDLRRAALVSMALERATRSGYEVPKRVLRKLANGLVSLADASEVFTASGESADIRHVAAGMLAVTALEAHAGKALQLGQRRKLDACKAASSAVLDEWMASAAGCDSAGHVDVETIFFVQAATGLGWVSSCASDLVGLESLVVWSADGWGAWGGESTSFGLAVAANVLKRMERVLPTRRSKREELGQLVVAVRGNAPPMAWGELPPVLEAASGTAERPIGGIEFLIKVEDDWLVVGRSSDLDKPARLDISARGTFELRARLLRGDGVPDDSEDWSASAYGFRAEEPPGVLEGPLLSDLLGLGAGVTASSSLFEGETGAALIDGDERTAFYWATEDQEPWLRVEFAKPKKWEGLVLTHPVPTQEGAWYNRVQKVQVMLNGQASFELEMPSDSWQLGQLEFGKQLRVKTLELRVLKPTDGFRGLSELVLF